MADIDSSFLLFSKEISHNHKVVLSGECADEILVATHGFIEKNFTVLTASWIA